MKVARNKGRDTELKDIVQWLKLRRNRDAGRSWEEDSPRTPKDKNRIWPFMKSARGGHG
jgi:hypothetical protein